MRLSDYLKIHNIRPASFAKRLGVPRQTVHRYLRQTGDRRRPHWMIMNAIIRETNGAVSANDFLFLDAAE